jgi:hypothetical protein
MALGADEQYPLALSDDIGHDLLCALELAQGLVQVDEIDAVALGEDEPPHLRVPATGLVAEVDPGLEQGAELFADRHELGCLPLGFCLHRLRRSHDPAVQKHRTPVDPSTGV